jgi:hypothetical protein
MRYRGKSDEREVGAMRTRTMVMYEPVVGETTLGLKNKF